MGSLRDDVEEWVEEQLAGTPDIRVRGPKIIHDPVHGTNQFDELDIVLIDLPIVQRLRKISQVDFVSYVFP